MATPESLVVDRTSGQAWLFFQGEGGTQGIAGRGGGFFGVKGERSDEASASWALPTSKNSSQKGICIA